MLQPTSFPIIVQKVIGNDEVQAVNARDLYEKLECKHGFSKWIKMRLQQFDQDIDRALRNTSSQALGQKSERLGTGFGDDGVFKGQDKIDYILNLDTAKQIALMERNAKGKEIRRYFIEAEKVAKKLLSPSTPSITLEQQQDIALEFALEKQQLLMDSIERVHDKWYSMPDNWKQRNEQLDKDYKRIREIWKNESPMALQRALEDFAVDYRGQFFSSKEWNGHMEHMDEYNKLLGFGMRIQDRLICISPESDLRKIRTLEDIFLDYGVVQVSPSLLHQ